MDELGDKDVEGDSGDVDALEVVGEEHVQGDELGVSQWLLCVGAALLLELEEVLLLGVLEKKVQISIKMTMTMTTNLYLKQYRSSREVHEM